MTVIREKVVIYFNSQDGMVRYRLLRIYRSDSENNNFHIYSKDDKIELTYQMEIIKE